LLDDHGSRCVMGAEGAEQLHKTDELITAVGRLVRRG
jgi:CsoR family transcriptional regulator, copper-sensing transcriptional repressor